MRYSVLLLLVLPLASASAQAPTTSQFTLTFSKEVSAKPFTGRVLVMLGRSGEPRQGPGWFNPPPFFAKDVRDWKPGEPLAFGSEMLGFPKKLDALPAGEYVVQAVLDLDRGSHNLGTGPGNGFSKPVKATLDAKRGFNVTLTIDQIVPEPRFQETDRIKQVVIESKLLSAFHGKSIQLKAGVLLPKSFTVDASKTYPVIFEIPGFGGNHRSIQRMATPRDQRRGTVADFLPIDMVYVVLDPDCRTGHHVFADSANNGPYGQALTEELIPEIEKRFRGVGKPNARFLTGHSSGGWSSLWLQVTYPDFFGGTWSTSPDPVDFRDFQRINLYAPGANMFTDEQGQPRPLARRGDRVVILYKTFSDMEAVLARGGQLASFEAVFSPKDGNGQPRPLWDRQSGAVDPATARYWERYDIRLQLERNWATLGPRLRGKLHVHMGDKDTFYLEGATMRLKESLARLGSDAVVEIHPGKDHSSVMTPELYQRLATEMAASYRQHAGN